MAKEYIEREVALMGVMMAGCMANTVQVLKDIPAADVVEVKHGRWVDKWGGRYVNQCYKCSICGEYALGSDKHWYLTDYCPNCGAKMDGGAENGT